MSAQLNSAQLNSAQLNPAQLSSTQNNSTQLSSVSLNSAQLNSAQLMSAQLNSAQLNSAQLNPAPSPPLAPSSLLLSPSTGSDYLPFSALRLRLLFTLRPCALGALHVLRNSKIQGFEDYLEPWALSLVAVPLVSQTPANLRKTPLISLAPMCHTSANP